MKPEEIRAAMGQITAKLDGIVASDTGYTEDQLKEIEALNEEFDGLNAQLDAAERVEAMKAKASASAGRKVAPDKTAGNTTSVTVGASANERFGGFKSAGEFLNAVKERAYGKVAPQFQNAMYEKSMEDGGVLVPEEISTSILKKLDDPMESLLARVNKMNVGGNTMSLPVDEQTPWGGGIQAYWTAEGAPITESKPNFKQAHLRLHKLAALVKATDELLEDTVALESYIKNAAPQAITYKVNQAILNGNGVGKPMGLLKSGFAITVPKVSGQAADTIVAQNIVDMYSKMLPGSRGRAVWLADASVEPQLNGLKNSNGDYIYLQGGNYGINQAPYSTLLGRPVMPMLSGLPGLGDSGDLIFADLSFYYAIVKAGGLKQATSIHLHFDREITSFRFSFRIDGQVPFQTPVTSESGYTMSGIVKLADRA